MPYQEPDPTDPMTLHGVLLDAGGPEALRDMAECFIEEYLRLGFSRQRILQIFQTRAYAGPDLARRALGPELIAAVLDECLKRRPQHPPPTTPARRQNGDFMLPVLEG